MAVWLQAKVYERGRELQPRLNAGLVCTVPIRQDMRLCTCYCTLLFLYNVDLIGYGNY